MSDRPEQLVHRLSARVHGRVQGVGYRMFALESARRHRVTGWVRNMPGGTVEVLAEGDETALTELLTELYRGPIVGHVRDIEVEWSDGPRQFADFQILR